MSVTSSFQSGDGLIRRGPWFSKCLHVEESLTTVYELFTVRMFAAGLHSITIRRTTKTLYSASATPLTVS